MADKVLPPLPPSDEGAMARNHYDRFYNVSARGFWGENEIIHIPDTPTKPCEHKFEITTDGVKCRKCHFGLLGSGFEIREEQLFFQGEPIRFTR